MACWTALAIRCATVLSKGEGMILSAVGITAEASACTAAIFIAGVIVEAPASSAPRNIPGKARTLLTWLGKSLRPVPTTAAPPARFGMPFHWS